MLKILQNKRSCDVCIVSIFFGMICLFYPVMFFISGVFVKNVSWLKAFDTISLSAFAICAILLRYKKLVSILKNNKAFSFAILILFITCSYASFDSKIYHLENYINAIRWITIPLFICCYHQTFSKLFPYFMGLIWLVDIYNSTLLLIYKIEFVGLAGNRNWHAAMIVITTPFVLKILYDLFEKYKDIAFYLLLSIFPIFLFIFIFAIQITKSSWQWLYLLTLIPTLFCLFKVVKIKTNKFAIYATLMILIQSFFFLYLCFSRGGMLAMIFSIIVCIYLYLDKTNKQEFLLKRAMLFLIIILVAIFIFSVHYNYYSINDKIQEQIEKDVRIPMWQGVCQMSLDNKLGVGEQNFESKFARYRNIDYWLTPVPSTRSNHPHNHFFYFMACYGVLGFFTWCFLIFFPFIKNALSFRQFNSQDKILIFTLLALLTHSFFDLIVFEWPTNIIFLIFIGIFLGKCLNLKEEEYQSSNLIKNLFKISIVLLMTFIVKHTYDEIFFGYYARGGLLAKSKGDFKNANYFFKKAGEYKKDKTIMYKQAINLFKNLQEVDESVACFKFLSDNLCENFANIHLFQGYMFSRIGKNEEALEEFRKQTLSYPISVGSWYKLFYLLKANNKKEEAKEAAKMVLFSMQLKKVPIEYLLFLINRPLIDKNFRRLPKDNKLLENKEYVDEAMKVIANLLSVFSKEELENMGFIKK